MEGHGVEVLSVQEENVSIHPEMKRWRKEAVWRVFFFFSALPFEIHNSSSADVFTTLKHNIPRGY